MKSRLGCAGVALCLAGCSGPGGEPAGAMILDGVTYVPFVGVASGLPAKADALSVHPSSGQAPPNVSAGGGDRQTEADRNLARMRPLDAMPLEDLAEGLRSVAILPDGRAFIEKDQRWDLAHSTKYGPRDSVKVEGHDPLLPPPPSAQVQANGVGVLGGSDDRTKISTDNRQTRTVVNLFGGRDDPAFNSCSGVIVGWRTIITAAHCLYKSASGSFARNLVITPFAKGSEFRRIRDANGQLFPYEDKVPKGIYGSFQMSEHNCIAHVPAGYITNPSELSWDFGYISCASEPTPISRTGWNGYWVNPPGSNQDMKIFGYPGARDDPPSERTASWCPSQGTTWPVLCGMPGQGEIYEGRLETLNMDQTSGQSGGPWQRSDGYVIGVAKGYLEYFNFWHCGFDYCKRNIGKVLDNAFFSFVAGGSPDW